MPRKTAPCQYEPCNNEHRNLKYCSLLCSNTDKYGADAEFSQTHKRKARRYGITAQALEELFSEHEGTCEICDNPATDIDHDHTTGEIRGLLCNACNSGIGKLRDNLETVLKAAVYLAKKDPRLKEIQDPPDADRVLH